jgi:2-polyprenyl-3-methyl-5-hydroxy-6-metoxy-1,4-benzoquinol methylase
MKPISFDRFALVYRDAVDSVWQHWNPEMQTSLAKHCTAWGPGRTDFLDYLRLSAVRFYGAYVAAIENECASICDVGGFWGVWPITAAKLGFRAAMTETLRFYGRAFDPLLEHIRMSGVDIFDLDPFAPDAVINETFQMVTAMAVLEHYPHSLRVFMINLSRLTSDGGNIFLEVPNIAYWPKRTALLRGESPLPELRDIYRSEVPFIGHHHEFTTAELLELAELSGLEVTHLRHFNYSLASKNKLRLAVRHPLMSLAFALAPATRECIAITSRKREEGIHH